MIYLIYGGIVMITAEEARRITINSPIYVLVSKINAQIDKEASIGKYSTLVPDINYHVSLIDKVMNVYRSVGYKIDFIPASENDPASFRIEWDYPTGIRASKSKMKADRYRTTLNESICDMLDQRIREVAKDGQFELTFDFPKDFDDYPRFELMLQDNGFEVRRVSSGDNVVGFLIRWPEE
jgi:hypothetical protein